VDYPTWTRPHWFAAQLEALGATIQSAVAEGEKKRLDEAKDRAASIRKLLAAISRIDGKAEVGSQADQELRGVLRGFGRDGRTVPGHAPGRPGRCDPKMQGALQKLEADLAAARVQASEGFEAGLENAQRGVSSSLWAIVISGAVVVLLPGRRLLPLIIGGVWRQLGGDRSTHAT
jgi:methyl-accepting chemotaxis protein